MNCPCGKHKVDPRAFRDWLASTQEARMHASAVLKSQTLGGEIGPCSIDGKLGLWVGPPPPAAREHRPAPPGWLQRITRALRK